jgi:hypothetical protein
VLGTVPDHVSFGPVRVVTIVCRFVHRLEGRLRDASALRAGRVPTDPPVSIARGMEPSPVVRFYGSDGEAADAIVPIARERTATPAGLPPDPRLSAATLAAFAALAGVLAIAVGAWAFVSSATDDGQPAEVVVEQDLVSLLAKPDTERIRLRGSVGRIVLVAGAGGEAALVLDGLGIAPAGRSYQAWVTRPGAARPVSAAVFGGGETAVPLAGPVPTGTIVAVTLERAGGAAELSRGPRVSAVR